MNLNEIKKKLKKNLDKPRYEHTKGVMYTAGCLAMAYEFSIDKAMLAGLLHDCAKCLSTSEKIEICERNNVLITDVEYSNPGLLHAKAGAVLAEEIYGVTEPDILHSIRVHTTGTPGMSLLDKIVFVADYIEPGRDRAPRLEYIRQLSFQNIDCAVAEILYDTIKYVNTSNTSVDPTTQITYDYYKQYREV